MSSGWMRYEQVYSSWSPQEGQPESRSVTVSPQAGHGSEKGARLAAAASLMSGVAFLFGRRIVSGLRTKMGRRAEDRLHHLL